MKQTDLNTLRNMLGQASQQAASGRIAQAQMLCAQVIAKAPEFADAHFVLGIIHDGAGQTSEAISAYRKAIDINPDYRDARVNLAISLRSAGDYEAAARCFERAVEIDPDFVPALTGLGTVLSNLKRYDQSISVYGKALKITQAPAQIHRAIANALARTGRQKEALTHLEQALILKPDWHDALMDMVGLLQGMGDFERARKILAGIIDRGTDDGYVYYALANIRDSAIDIAATLERTEKALQANGLRPANQAAFSFAAGRLAERLGDAERAFKHYDAGNKTYFKRFNYNRDAISKWFDSLAEAYTRALISEKAALSKTGHAPIFVVGMPRSGTTLTEQILASHPDVHGVGESENIGRIVRLLTKAPDNRKPYPDCLPDFTSEDIEHFAKGYLAATAPGHFETKRIVDKTPQNFLRLGLIQMLFPNSRIVHCRRDPRDVSLSNYFSLFHGNEQSFAYDLPTLGFYYRHYDRLMAHWRDILPRPIHDIRYEELVADPELQIRSLLDFCGLDWNEACLQFHKTERVVETASMWQVRQPMYKSSAGKWRKYEKHLGPLKQELGALWTE